MKILIQHTEREKTEMADIDDTYKTHKMSFIKRSKKKEKKYKRANDVSNFKRNMPKRLRKEWGARMQFFRSL